MGDNNVAGSADRCVEKVDNGDGLAGAGGVEGDGEGVNPRIGGGKGVTGRQGGQRIGAGEVNGATVKGRRVVDGISHGDGEGLNRAGTVNARDAGDCRTCGLSSRLGDVVQVNAASDIQKE